MVFRRSAALFLAAALVGLPAPVAASAAKSKRPVRVIKWSGYKWTVRHSSKVESPGRNKWGDSRFNARLTSDKRLRLNIYKGRSSEITGPRTGYGHYTWVVDSDLSAADPFRVAAFFVRSVGGEQDIEFCRWGEPDMAAAGTWVSWRGQSKRLGWGAFMVTPFPPYTIEIDLQVRRTHFSVRDAIGTVLLNHTFASAKAGKRIAPRVSYWLYPGHAKLKNPYTSKTIHPPLFVRSFKYRRNPRS